MGGSHIVRCLKRGGGYILGVRGRPTFWEGRDYSPLILDKIPTLRGLIKSSYIFILWSCGCKKAVMIGLYNLKCSVLFACDSDWSQNSVC